MYGNRAATHPMQQRSFGEGGPEVANRLGYWCRCGGDRPGTDCQDGGRYPRRSVLPRRVRLHTPGGDQRLPCRCLTRAVLYPAPAMALHGPVRFGHAQRLVGWLVRPPVRPQPGVGVLGPDTSVFGSPVGLYAIHDLLRRRAVRVAFSPPVEPHRFTPAVFAVIGGIRRRGLSPPAGGSLLAGVPIRATASTRRRVPGQQ